MNASGQSDIVGTNVTTGYNGELYQIAIYRLTNDTLNINGLTNISLYSYWYVYVHRVSTFKWLDENTLNEGYAPFKENWWSMI